jgi:hypothetical protein
MSQFQNGLYMVVRWVMCYGGALRHFQQYFSYIMVSVLLSEETGEPRENHRPAASH